MERAMAQPKDMTAAVRAFPIAARLSSRIAFNRGEA